MFEQSKEYRWWLERRELAPNTYTSHLPIFFRYLGNVLGVKEEEFSVDHFYVDDLTGRTFPIDRSLIQNFLIWLSEEYCDRPSVPYLAYAAVKNFFRTLHENGLIYVDPTIGIKGPKAFKHPRTTSLSTQELQQLINSAFREAPFSRKYVAIILLLAHGGLRNSELRSLTIEKIDFTHGFVVVDEGQKTAPGIVYMSPLLSEALQHYVQYETTHRNDETSGSRYLFLSDKGNPLSAVTLTSITTRLAKKAGIKTLVTPHVLRHTCATEMARGGVHPADVRDHLRQRDTSTTLVYVNQDVEEKRRVLEDSTMHTTIGPLFD